MIDELKQWGYEKGKADMLKVIEDKCKNCKWRKDSDEVFRRGVSMEDLCAACHIRSNRK